VWGLFIDDGVLAIATVAVLFGVALFADHFGDQHSIAGLLFIAGVLLAVWAGLTDATRGKRRHAASTAVPSMEVAPSAAVIMADGVADRRLA
jgi:hypothetical protein